MSYEVKTTTRTTRTQGLGDNDFDTSYSSTYRPSVTPRSIIIQRNTFSGGPGSIAGGFSSSTTTRTQRSGGFGGGLTLASYAPLANSGVLDVKNSREKEKKDMQDLNERFASYIEKVRFLEAQNKKLTDELEKLKSRWGKETSQIKAMYQAELEEARKLIDDAEKEKARLEIKVASLEEVNQELLAKLGEVQELSDQRRLKIEEQDRQLSDYEAEVALLRRRLESLEGDKERDKKTILTLTQNLNAARANLDDETLRHIDAENRRQTLEEELEFTKTIHEQELKELAALAYRDTTAENRDFWKNEMGAALREIQDMYDDKLEMMRSEIETTYSQKLQEYRTGATRQTMENTHTKEETKRLRLQLTELRDKLADLEGKNLQLLRELDGVKRSKEDLERQYELETTELKGTIASLRAELEAILQELQNIMDTKLGLELEIAAYRKLLEGEESRVGLKQFVDIYSSGGGSGGGGGGNGGFSAAFSSGGGGGGGLGGFGEIQAKTTFQKSAKGPTNIAEVAKDGSFILLENNGRKNENLGGWKVSRVVDGKEVLNFSFPDDYEISSGEKFKLYAKGKKPGKSGPFDLESDVDNFQDGARIVTKLLNKAGEERASHVQNTTYG